MIWFRKSNSQAQTIPDLINSILYNEATFYNHFINDLSAIKEGEKAIKYEYLTFFVA
jgi:hypothetical protein